MPVPKLKTLAILILLLANLAMALQVLPDRMAVKREEDALRESLCSLYDRQEIALDPETIPDTTNLYVLELTENSDLQAAKVLLGEQLLAEDDSTRYVSAYRSALGQCSISRSGTFSAQLTQSRPVRDPERAGRKLLKAMGFSYLPLPEVQQRQDGVCTLTATQTVLDMPVFSDGLTLTYTDSCLTELEGVFFTGTNALSRVSSEGCISAADALVAFLDSRYELGWVGSTVTALYQGYVHAETAAAAVVRLAPVWRLETDTGVFQIHGMTGEVTAVE